MVQHEPATRLGAKRTCPCPFHVIVLLQAVVLNDVLNAELRQDGVEVAAQQPVAEHSSRAASPVALHAQALLRRLLELDLVDDGAIRPLRDAITRLVDGLVYNGSHTPRGILVKTLKTSRWVKPGQIINIGRARIGAAPTHGHLRLVHLLDHDMSIA